MKNNPQEKFMVSEAYLAYRSFSNEKIAITSSINVNEFVRSKWPDDMQILERFMILLLNNANVVTAYHWISQGGLTGTVVDPRIICKSAVESLAAAIICVHNHPSGNLKPSSGDQTITEKLKNALNLFDVKLLDHIIITSDGYFSSADNGLIN